MKHLALLALLVCPALAQTDGPATLPQRTPATSFTSSNPVTTVPIAGLQAALTAAKCGDSLNVLPGDWTGGLTMPTGCDAAHAITIKGQLGTRVLECGSDHIAGGSFYTLDTFEVTRPSTCVTVTYNLINPGAGSHDLIFTNLNVHGDATHETTRGLQLGGTTNVAVLNSQFTNFFCIAVTGTCTDAQAIAFGIGDVPNGGSYLIEGNLLQSSGENILAGGGADTTTPCDITILNNEFSKPFSWMPGSSTFDGITRIVKNLFELKNACRVLVANNILSGTWGGFSQDGSAILLTPKNPNGNCTNCEVLDVTIRNNRVEYSGVSLQLACALSDNGTAPLACGNWSIHDNLFIHQQYKGCSNCYGQWLVQLGSVAAPLLHGVSIVHNTFQVDGWLAKYHGFLTLGNYPAPSQIQNIHFDQNVVPEGNMPMYSTGGTTNCAYQVDFVSYTELIANCWDSASTFTGNVILKAGETKPVTAPDSTWPAGNFVVDAGANPYLLP